MSRQPTTSSKIWLRTRLGAGTVALSAAVARYSGGRTGLCHADTSNAYRYAPGAAPGHNEACPVSELARGCRPPRGHGPLRRGHLREFPRADGGLPKPLARHVPRVPRDAVLNGTRGAGIGGLGAGAAGRRAAHGRRGAVEGGHRGAEATARGRHALGVGVLQRGAVEVGAEQGGPWGPSRGRAAALHLWQAGLSRRHWGLPRRLGRRGRRRRGVRGPKSQPALAVFEGGPLVPPALKRDIPEVRLIDMDLGF
eukprot:CAMPEP_0174297108 /NCGR_PEP_ID=MMETSP0809-20121228/50078_1 /TAXON_ID=73025 ORGANISM="Eutreptiella gymnastica-like, Strain CCMP1594" /NCGR_SAMPLE_ID=MMETSP0809 /ASSEMBLY_ACC=CAM_ASM_000658 /LENGTH=252 /DNA_ID=CAMNT_0015400669 /DNA_START=270 /DNA_END=1028 /DNA_ORIENTATION=-